MHSINNGAHQSYSPQSGSTHLPDFFFLLQFLFLFGKVGLLVFLIPIVVDRDLSSNSLKLLNARSSSFIHCCKSS